MRADLRQALQRMRQQPTFAAGIIVILTLAIGAVSVVLAVSDAVILRPLPYQEPARLTIVWEVGAEHQEVNEISHRNYVDWRARAQTFDELAAFGSVNWDQRLTGFGDPFKVPAAAVSASFFDVLGVPPQLGRVLLASDDRPKSSPVVVISHGFWQRLLGGAPDALGRRLTLDGEPFEVVGVMPRGFDFPTGADLWIPVAPQIDAASAGLRTDALEARWFGVLFAIGRLRSGATIDQARAELDAINVDLDRLGEPRARRSVVLTPLETRLLGNTRPALVLLLAAVSLIVLIACANVTTLLLARASRTQAETAVRISLGASGRHVYRLWLAEALVLFGIAAPAGLMLASLMLPLIIRLAPESVYRIGEARLTLPVIAGIAVTMIVAAAAVAAAITALSTARLRLAETLRDAASITSSSRMRAVRRVLVTAEITVACVLLIGSGLTIRSFMNLRSLDLGFDPNGVLTVSVSPSREQRRDANRALYAPLLERLNALPDVIAAGGIFLRPLAFAAIGTDSRALPEGSAVDDQTVWQRSAIPVNKETATPGYFTAMRIPLRDGRYFVESDNERAPLVAIVSESAARRLFPAGRAVGSRVMAPGEATGPDGRLPWRTIVGVVADVRYRGLQDVRFDYYLPYLQIPDRVQHLVVRTRGNPLQAIAQLRTEVRRLDPLAIVEGATTMTEVVDRAIAPWRLYMVLFAVLGALALAMAIAGVYGVVQYAVVERWHELGIRAALGASVRQLTTPIVNEGAVLAAAGLTLGIGAAWGAARLMSAILFGVAPTDEVTFAATAAILAALVAAASYIPARIAGRADPALLLRAR